ncbi:hypothetical protein [Rufibacter psychrotolerans]|uniref:hypothetical protein n=1 Tax=Rufibacter psychrotolerans TaxID=2812556 RepID=UPI001967ADF9|nr:hypothetical protein [Rufibacter sp. SYSU D00308]
MITVLMPSNFKQDSLAYIPELVETFPGMPLKVVLFHPFGLSSSIQELLLLSREADEDKLVSREFLRACSKLREAQPTLVALEWTCFYGSTMLAFRSFLEAHAVDLVATPATYEHESLGPQSLSPFQFLNKCPLPVIPLALPVTAEKPLASYAF